MPQLDGVSGGTQGPILKIVSYFRPDGKLAPAAGDFPGPGA